MDHAWLQEEQQEEKMKVEIQGAVQRPGVYFFPQGTRLKALLEEAQPLPEADLRAIRQNQKLRFGQCVHIPERPWITIYLSGAALRAGAYRVREGTPLSALPELCPLHPQADLKGLQSKRRLVDEEHIHIPFLDKRKVE